MLGERSDQRGLWEADRLYLDHVGKDTFYGLLASLRGRLFRDSDFAGFYCADNGRDSVPPSLLALQNKNIGKETDAERSERTYRTALGRYAAAHTVGQWSSHQRPGGGGRQEAGEQG